MARTTATRTPSASHPIASPAHESGVSANVQEQVVVAIMELNAERGHLAFYTPTEISDHLRKIRSTIAMRLMKMRDKGLLVFYRAENVTPVRGAFGYYYALPGTPRTDEPQIAVPSAEADAINAKALAAAREHDVRARAPQTVAPRRPRKTATHGRIRVSQSADERLWNQARRIAAAKGIPATQVLDQVLGAYIAVEDATTPDPHAQVRNAFRSTSRPPRREEQTAVAAAS